VHRTNTRNGITSGLLLIGLGVLLYTDWWWPGIMLVVGIAVASGLVFRNRYREAVVVAIIFFGIPLLVASGLRWDLYAPIVLIGLGIVVLAKTLILREP
jgi:hypothetical protein